MSSRKQEPLQKSSESKRMQSPSRSGWPPSSWRWPAFRQCRDRNRCLSPRQRRWSQDHGSRCLGRRSGHRHRKDGPGTQSSADSWTTVGSGTTSTRRTSDESRAEAAARHLEDAVIFTRAAEQTGKAYRHARPSARMIRAISSFTTRRNCFSTHLASRFESGLPRSYWASGGMWSGVACVPTRHRKKLLHGHPPRRASDVIPCACCN